MKLNLKMYDENKKIIVVESVGYESALQHDHDFIEMVFIKSGRAVHQVDSFRSFVGEGDFIIINTGHKHSLRPVKKEEPFEIINILLDPALFEELDFKYDEIFHFEKETKKYIDDLVEEYKEEGDFEFCYLSVQNIINCCKMQRIIRNNKKHDNLKNKETSNDYIDKTIFFIKKNYAKKINLLDIANNVGLCPAYLQKIFRMKCKTSIMRYLQHYRMEIACQYLIETDLKINEISMLVGIEDNKNFYTYFTKYFSITPQKFREEHKLIIKQIEKPD